MFRITLLAVMYLIQFVLFRRTWKWLKATYPAARALRVATAGLFIFFNAIFLVIVLVRPRVVALPEWMTVFGLYPFYIWYGATFFLGVLIGVAHLVKLPFKVLLWISTRFSHVRERVRALKQRPSYQEFDASRRVFLRRGMYGLTAASFGTTAYGAILGKSRPEVTVAEFFIPSLDPSLDGFTIALVSDVHSSIFMTKQDMDEYVALLNGMKADVIAVTGDMVNSLTDEVYPFAEAFSALKAAHGVYGVMGNHDFFTPNPELVAREINDCGVTMLRNDRVAITRGGASFDLLGVDDVRNPKQATEKIRVARGSSTPVRPRVLLCHRPYFLPQASDENIDLMLSGHTHGGQIVLGAFGDTFITPAALASPYVWGAYSHGNTGMYVSRGIGTVGLPVRINCPPELTRIVLRSGSRTPNS